MIKVPNTEDLEDFDLRDYKVPQQEKYTDRRGFMYIVYDSLFPAYIKVGRTSDCFKRLVGYNSDRPYPTCKMLYISEMFEDINETERKILAYMYDNTPPTTLSKEWFEIKYKDNIIKIIEKAEKIEKETRAVENHLEEKLQDILKYYDELNNTELSDNELSFKDGIAYVLNELEITDGE